MSNLTLEQIHERCEEEGASCWLWQGAFRQGQCIITVRQPDGKRKTMAVRRRVAELMGMSIDGKLVSCRCHDYRCVSPDCIVVLTRQQLQAQTVKRLGFHMRPEVRAKSAERSRQRTNMTMEKAEQIRSSDLNGRQAAKEFGTTAQVVSRIRTNRSWVDLRRSWTSGLGAR